MEFHDLEFSIGFLSMIPTAQVIKENIDKLDCGKNEKLLCIKRYYQGRDNLQNGRIYL